MALPKLENALLTMRICSISFCCIALIMYVGNGQRILQNMNLSSLPSVAIQIAVTLLELLAPFCCEAPNALPNHLGWSAVIIIVECLSAYFLMITSLGGIGVFTYGVHTHSCFHACKSSLLYTLFGLFGSVFGGTAAVCNTVLAAKLKLQHQA